MPVMGAWECPQIFPTKPQKGAVQLGLDIPQGGVHFQTEQESEEHAASPQPPTWCLQPQG